MQLSCIWFTILHTSFMIGCVIFYFFYKDSWWVSRLFVGVPLDVEIRVESVVKTDVVWMMYCTTEKPKHSAAQRCTAAEVAPCFTCLPPLLQSRAGFLPRCNSSLLMCSLALHSRLLTIKCYSTYKSICEMTLLDIGVFAFMVAWFLSAMHQVPLEQSYLNQTRLLLMPHQGSLLTSLGFFSPTMASW